MTNSQSWNRYSYVENRPILLNDPTGHDSVCGYSYSDPECADVPATTIPPVDPPDDNGNNNGNGGPQGDLEEELQVKTEQEKALEQMQYCLEHLHVPECNIPQPDTLQSLQIKYDFIAPWEFEKLDAWGFRFNVTFCRVICLVDFSFDLLGNSMLREGTFFITLTGPSTSGGWGQDASIGLVGAYDAPDMTSLEGAGSTTSVNFTPGLGGQVSYSNSLSHNVTGNYAQTWSLALSTGTEISVAHGVGYSYPIFTLDENRFYLGLK